MTDWSEAQIADGKRWVAAWAEAGLALEKIRRQELRRLDPVRAVAMLCGPGNYRNGPRTARTGSGLVEQQRWFLRAARRD